MDRIILSDREKEHKHELTGSVKPKQEDQDNTTLNLSINEKLESRTTDHQSINDSPIDSSYIDQLIENLLSKLFASSLNGETFVDEEINKFLDDFVHQIQVERDFQDDRLEPIV